MGVVAPQIIWRLRAQPAETTLPSKFLTLGVPADLAACLEKLNITEPYPVQSATLPDAFNGHDLFVQSPTGSGKTLAFAIPLVSRLANTRAGRPRSLILAPTRELAAQIAETIGPLARVANLRVAAFYGGAGYKPQLDALRRGVDIVVGCPGRLLDLLERGVLRLSDVEAVVVDEADRMADMGFLPAVKQLLNEVRGSRQTMLYSATLTKEVEHLVRNYQQHPKRHVLEQPSDDVGSRTHEFWRTPREDHVRLTAELVAAHYSSIVFCRTKRGVDRLTRQLSQFGVRAVAIHGDRSQAQRDRALEQFKAGSAHVLVGTDVASRGLHVDGVECVVHYDPPEDADTYLHRSGRTGRAGSSGRVVSLVAPDHEREVRRMATHLGLDARLVSPSGQDGVSKREGAPDLGRPASQAPARMHNVHRDKPVVHRERVVPSNPRKRRGPTTSGRPSARSRSALSVSRNSRRAP